MTSVGTLNANRAGMGMVCRVWGVYVGPLSVSLQRLTKDGSGVVVSWQVLIQWTLV